MKSPKRGDIINISKYARGQQWIVSLSGKGAVSQGVVLCNQARMTDWRTRKAQVIES